MKFFYCTVFLLLALINLNEAKFSMRVKDKMDKGLLKDLDAETKQKFLEVFKNKDLTKRQFEQKMDELVAGLSDEQKMKFQAFKQKREQKVAEIKKKVALILPTLSPEAQQLVNSIQAVFENKDITGTQQREQLHYYNFTPLFHLEEFRYGSYFETDFANTEICQGKDEYLCVPGLMKHFSTIYIAPRYNLTACTIPKNMSTMMRAIMCFLMDPNTFGEEKEKFSDYYGSYRCPGLKQSNFHSYESVRKNFPSFSPERGTMVALVRDPIERFVSGFIDKCYFENRCNECGKSLSCFLIEFYEKTMRSFRNPMGYIEDNYMTRHFFPQNWQCEFSNYFGNYSVIKYSSGKGKASFYNELRRVLSLARVPEQKVEFVLERLRSEKTRHVTDKGFLKNLKKEIYEQLYSSPYLMELLIRIYYQDFVLFGFDIPDLKDIYFKSQYKRR